MSPIRPLSVIQAEVHQRDGMSLLLPLSHSWIILVVGICKSPGSVAV